MLYKFEKLNRRLDQLGFPKVRGGSGFKTIKGVDFEKAFKAGSISFENDGIYLNYEGKKHRGYMFIQQYNITYNGNHQGFPKFHLLKCSTIQSFINSGQFKHRYEWSNSNINNLIDKQTGRRYDNQRLDLCSNCKSSLFRSINTTQDFFDSLDKSEIETKNVEVDILGYVKGKEKISSDYRKRQNYTCEKCSVSPKSSLHKRWWHTHHVNGDKTNNKLSNLKCFCILCHSKVDQRHIENFKKGAMPKQLEFFKKEYQMELRKCDNPYL